MSLVSVTAMKEIKPTICRVCLQNGEKFLSVFEQMGQLQVYEHIMSIALVTISPEDGLPDLVCPACLLQLQAAITFKNKCEESDRILHTAYQESLPVTNKVPEEKSITIKQEDETVIEDASEEFLEDLEDFLCEADSSAIIPTPAKGQQFSPQCDDCKKYFRSKCKLRVHWKKEHLKKSYICGQCKREFKSRWAYDKHKANGSRSCLELKNSDKVLIVGEGKTRLYQCKQCEYKTNRYIHIRTHLVVHTPGEKPYKCDLCPSAYSQRGSLSQHVAEQHDPSMRPTCHICGKTVGSNRRLYRHLWVHREASFPCPTCKKLFKTKKSLQNHSLRHLGQKQCQCELCPATFYTLAELCNHRRCLHKSMVKCSVCEFQCKNEERLKKHEVQHGGDKFPCGKCGKFYESALHLRKHLRKFHKPKHHQCPICFKTYTTRKSTVYHMKRKHGSSAPFNIKHLGLMGKVFSVTKFEPRVHSSDETSSD